MYVFLVLKWRSKFPVFYAAMGSVNSTDKNHGRHVVPGKILLKYSKPRVITHKMLSISRSVNDCRVMCACILTKFGLSNFSTLTKAQTQKIIFKPCSEHLWSWVPKAWPFCQCEEGSCISQAPVTFSQDRQNRNNERSEIPLPGQFPISKSKH
jgi:hypothetical protein